MQSKHILQMQDMPLSPAIGPVEEGDMILILKKDGTVKPITTGISPEIAQALKDAGRRVLTQPEQSMVEQVNRLLAHVLADGSPEIMSELIEMVGKTPAETMTGRRN